MGLLIELVSPYSRQMFGHDLIEDAHEKKHMTVDEAARLVAASIDVKRRALIHYSPRYTEPELKQLLKEAQAIFPNTVFTRDRAVFPVEYREP